MSRDTTGGTGPVGAPPADAVAEAGRQGLLFEGMVGSISWRDLDEPAETAKPMQFWVKALA